MTTAPCTGTVFLTTFGWATSACTHVPLQSSSTDGGYRRWQKIDPSKPASSWMKPLVRGRVTDLVEIPMNWFQDGRLRALGYVTEGLLTPTDFIPLTFVQNMPNCGGWQDPETITKIWKDRFTYFYREYDYFIFPIWYVHGTSYV